MGVKGSRKKKKELILNTERVEVEVMRMCKPHVNVVVPTVGFGMQYQGKLMHECDVLSLNKTGYATEYEIKISKVDFKKDFEKKHKHNHKLIKNLYYVYPKELHSLALELVPNTHGLITIESKNGKITLNTIRKATPRKDAVKWNTKLRLNLLRLGTMRILGLKDKILKLKE